MSNVYNSYFFNEFYQENGGGNYTDSKLWTPFFEMIAERIMNIFNPKKVLDAGCACGYLVAALRDKGVEAYGIDISDYAIEKARKDIRPYLNVQSITENLPEKFPSKYDLVVTIEVLEHLFPEEGRKAIELLCSYSDTVLFTSTPTDIEDKTHVNVQQKEYWAKIFAEQSFYRDLYQPVDFICGWAMLFRKRDDISKVIFEYELSDRVEAIKKKEEKKEKFKCYYRLEGQEFFSEEFSTERLYAITEERIEIEINQNKVITALRIDPMECNCIIKHFHVYDLLNDREELSVRSMNGMISNSRIIFSSNDPMIEIEVPQNKGLVYLEVTFEVEHLESSLISDTYHMLASERKQADKLRKEKTVCQQEMDTSVNELQEKCVVLQQEKLFVEQQMEKLKKEQEEEMGVITEELIKKLEGYQDAEQKIRETYEEGIRRLTARCAELEHEKRKIQSVQMDYLKEKEVLAAKLEEFIRQKNELERSYENKREKVEKLQDEKAELSRENEVLKLRLEAVEKIKKELALVEKQLEQTKKESSATAAKQEKEYQEKIKNLADIIDEKTAASEELCEECEKTKIELEKLQEELDYYTMHYHAAMNQRAELHAELDHYILHYQTAINQREDLTAQNRILQRQKADFETHYNNAISSYLAVTSSTCWKITSPLRKIMDFIKGEKIHEKAEPSTLFDPKELAEQKKTTFGKDIKFSILVPLYNTPLNFLHEMIKSVTDQTYANWELCLADGSDDEHRNVKSEVLKLAKKDRRIKYKKLKENKGISENTNECIAMATGDYIVLFDHDDVLHPSALYEVMKAICEQDADFIYTDENTFSDKIENAYWPHYKPDYSPDTLRSYNYICHLSTFKKELLEKAGGGFRKEFDGSQDYDMVLRLTEVAEHIVHIPKVLYYWRAHKNSVASDISAKPYTLTAAKKALSEHLERVGLKGKVYDAVIPSTYQIKYEIKGKPLVSIIIPNKDHIDDLDKCIQSVEKKSTYKHYEIIVVENNSTEAETLEYYKKIQRKYKNIKVVTWREGFNYSKINNFGFKHAKGEYIVLLNNDIEIITPDWLEQMLMYTQRSEVGAVGMMLYYPDDTIQHAGVILGIGGVAGHSHKYFKRGDYGYASRLCIAQNLSAVTAASMMIRSDVYKQIGGLDEGFAVAFNDVDLCMKIREAGYLIVWTPYAEAYHYESKSRGFEDTPEKQERFRGEIERFMDKWGDDLEQGDPYYNPNLTLVREDFSFK